VGGVRELRSLLQPDLFVESVTCTVYDRVRGATGGRRTIRGAGQDEFDAGSMVAWAAKAMGIPDDGDGNRWWDRSSMCTVAIPADGVVRETHRTAAPVKVIDAEPAECR
jgi:hypothetical protein